jgi:hypothetical protein
MCQGAKEALSSENIHLMASLQHLKMYLTSSTGSVIHVGSEIYRALRYYLPYIYIMLAAITGAAICIE